MVIQRLQNLYLMIAAILIAVYAFISSLIVKAGEMVYAFDCIKVASQEGVKYLPVSMILAVLTFALIVISIAKFKDLKIQKSAVYRSTLICAALVAYMVVNAYLVADAMGASLSFTWAIALPVVAIVLQYLAVKGIKHDIKLLSDSDRIR